VGQGLLIDEALRLYSDTPHAVELLWTSDQLVAGTSTGQHPILTTDIHATDGIRNHNFSRRAVADLRPRGRWNRHSFYQKDPVTVIVQGNYHCDVSHVSSWCKQNAKILNANVGGSGVWRS